MATETVNQTFHQESITTIRDALHIGLECLGEVERMIDVHGLYKNHGGGLPDDLRPLHPTGTNDTIGRFAAALRALEVLAH